MELYSIAARKDEQSYSPLKRQEKRVERKACGNETYQAYLCGEYAQLCALYESSRRNPRSNPYPPGLRRNAWDQGFKCPRP